MIVINHNLLENIYEHVRQAYPHECCGVLVGKNDPKAIVGVYPVKNLNQERAHDRYEMDPQEYQHIEQQAKIDGLSVLGFYHSHPDHPCAPSEFDTQAAWGAYQFSREIYSYIIVAVQGGEKVQISSWTLTAQGVFEEEKILNG